MRNFYSVDKYLKSKPNNTEKAEDFLDCVNSACHLDFVSELLWDKLQYKNEDEIIAVLSDPEYAQEKRFLVACHVRANKHDARFYDEVQEWARNEFNGDFKFCLPVHSYTLNRVIHNVYLNRFMPIL